MKRNVIVLLCLAVSAWAQITQIPNTGGGSGGAGGQLSIASAAYSAGTYYIAPGGGLAADATETNVQGLVGIAGSISNFTAKVAAAPGSGVTATFTFRKNAADTAVTCAITGDTDTSCSDVTHSFSIAVNDLIDIKMVVAGGTATSALVLTWGLPGVAGPGVAAGGTTGQMLVKSADGDYITTWSSTAPLATAVAGGSSGNVPYQTGAGVTAFSSLFNFTTSGSGTLGLSGGYTAGQTGVATGTYKINGTTSGTVTITGASEAGTWSLTLPTGGGSNGQCLQTDGSGVTTWGACGTGGSLPGYINSSDYASFALACTAAVAAPATLVVDQAWTALTTQSCAAPLLFTADADLEADTAQVITLTGGFEPVTWQVFSGAGTFKIGANAPVVYAEMWGAVGDGSTDDVTPINAALAAVTVSASNSPGHVHLLAKNYVVSAAVTVPSYVTLSGSGMRGYSATTKANTLLTSNSASASIISIAGGDANCGTTGIRFATIRDLSVTRSITATGTAKGISITNGCWILVENAESWNSIINFYQIGSANIRYRRTQAYWTASSGSSRWGYEVDSTSVGNNSTWYDNAVVACNGNNITGFYIHGLIADTIWNQPQTASCDYGLNIVSTDHTTWTNGDVKVFSPVFDTTRLTGIRVKDVYSTGGLESVLISGGHIDTNQTSSIGVDIDTSAGVTVTGTQIRMVDGTSKGVYLHGSSRQNIISGTKIDNAEFPIDLDTANNNVVTGNVVYSITGDAFTTGVRLAGSDKNTVAQNNISGFGTTGISLDATSDGNVIYPNVVDTTNITTAYAVTSGSVGNVSTGPGGSAPTVATCGTIGTNSTNAAGFITSDVTGTCAPVITFSSTAGVAANGNNCSMWNVTNPSNIMTQTEAGSSTTAAGFSGTTVTGDKLRYVCAGY